MVSARRNELLAELFQRNHRIEKWGRGIKTILEREPATEFEEIGTVQFIVTFMRKNPVAVSTETMQVSSVKTSEEIIFSIRSDKLVTSQQIADRLVLSVRAVEMQLAKLKSDGQIRRVGP